MSKKKNPKREFIETLAKMLGGPSQALVSIQIEAIEKGISTSPVTKQYVGDWRKLRESLGLFGYPSEKEVENKIINFLYGEGIKLGD